MLVLWGAVPYVHNQRSWSYFSYDGFMEGYNGEALNVGRDGGITLYYLI